MCMSLKSWTPLLLVMFAYFPLTFTRSSNYNSYNLIKPQYPIPMQYYLTTLYSCLWSEYDLHNTTWSTLITTDACIFFFKPWWSYTVDIHHIVKHHFFRVIVMVKNNHLKNMKITTHTLNLQSLSKHRPNFERQCYLLHIGIKKGKGDFLIQVIVILHYHSKEWYCRLFLPLDILAACWELNCTQLRE